MINNMIEPKEQVGHWAYTMPRAGRNEGCRRISVQKGRQGAKGLEADLEHPEPKCSGISIIKNYEQKESDK